MPKRTGKPAASLRDDLAVQQIERSTRQLERRGTAGLLASSFAADAARRAAAAEALLEREKTLDRAVIVMFLEGEYRVERDRIELAYRQFFGRASRLLDRFAAGPTTQDAAAGLAARLAIKAAKSASYRDLRRRLKHLREERFITIRSLLEEHYLELLHVLLTGRTTSETGMSDLLEGIGATAASRERIGDLPAPVPHPPLPALRRLFSELSLPTALRNLARATPEELEQARADALSFWQFSRAASRVLQRVHGLRDAFGFAAVAALPEIAVAAAVPGLMTLNRLLPDQVEWFREFVAEQSPRLQAMTELLDRLPPNLHRAFAGPECLAELGPPEAQQLRKVISEFGREHPADLELILSSEMPANQ